MQLWLNSVFHRGCFQRRRWWYQWLYLLHRTILMGREGNACRLAIYLRHTRQFPYFVDGWPRGNEPQHSDPPREESKTIAKRQALLFSRTLVSSVSQSLCLCQRPQTSRIVDGCEASFHRGRWMSVCWIDTAVLSLWFLSFIHITVMIREAILQSRDEFIRIKVLSWRRRRKTLSKCNWVQTWNITDSLPRLLSLLINLHLHFAELTRKLKLD